MNRASLFVLLTAVAWSAYAASTQNVPLATVIAKPVTKTIDLPGEVFPFLSVSIRAKVPGYVERVLVDRGSVVRRGDILIDLSAPEMEAQVAEAKSKAEAASAEQEQARAQLLSEQSTYERLKKAAGTPGAVAGNELVLAEQRVAAAQATLHSREQAVRAAQDAVRSAGALQTYLRITAPFPGVVTERLVHPGALVGPQSDGALLVLQQVSRLRLVVPVPEQEVGGIANGSTISFHVPAFPSRTYTGRIARVSHSIDEKTRTMPVELDVVNPDGTLAPGMYPSVAWPVRQTGKTTFVPLTSVVTTTERTFVIRDNGGKAEWVDVRKGYAEKDLVAVSGKLAAGDKVVKRATDEIRDGSALETRDR